MIFKQWQDVLSGRKTQTRRLVSENHTDDKTLAYDAMEWPDLRCIIPPKKISAVFSGVYTGDLRIKWAVGRTYAVQPGRGKKQIARIRLTGIRQEYVQDITEADAIAEGIELPVNVQAAGTLAGAIQFGFDIGLRRDAYAEIWDTIHTNPGTRWTDNPAVWVLEFELAEAKEDL
jgi:hypothetical protein